MYRSKMKKGVAKSPLIIKKPEKKFVEPNARTLKIPNKMAAPDKMPKITQSGRRNSNRIKITEYTDHETNIQYESAMEYLIPQLLPGQWLLPESALGTAGSFDITTTTVIDIERMENMPPINAQCVLEGFRTEYIKTTAGLKKIAQLTTGLAKHAGPLKGTSGTPPCI